MDRHKESEGHRSRAHPSGTPQVLTNAKVRLFNKDYPVRTKAQTPAKINRTRLICNEVDTNCGGPRQQPLAAAVLGSGHCVAGYSSESHPRCNHDIQSVTRLPILQPPNRTQKQLPRALRSLQAILHAFGANPGKRIDSGQQQGGVSLPASSAGGSSAPRGHRKRRIDQPPDRSGGGGGGKKQKGSLEQGLDGRPKHKLACPYFKLDPRTYHACGHGGLRNISDLRQHLGRPTHRQPPHCPVCKDVIYKNEERESHIAQQTCQERLREIPGVTQDQIDAMTQHCGCGTGTSVSDKWYRIWDILFPGVQRPSTPYYEASNIENILLRDTLQSFINEGHAQRAAASVVSLEFPHLISFLNNFIEYHQTRGTLPMPSAVLSLGLPTVMNPREYVEEPDIPVGPSFMDDLGYSSIHDQDDIFFVEDDEVA